MIYTFFAKVFGIYTSPTHGLNNAFTIIRPNVNIFGMVSVMYISYTP